MPTQKDQKNECRNKESKWQDRGYLEFSQNPRLSTGFQILQRLGPEVLLLLSLGTVGRPCETAVQKHSPG